MTSERTADADVVTVREFIDHHGYVDAPEGDRIPYGERDSDAMAALDRLVARNQQLQEALEQIAVGAHTAHPYQIARAALASVRARTPA